MLCGPVDGGRLPVVFDMVGADELEDDDDDDDDEEADEEELEEDEEDDDEELDREDVGLDALLSSTAVLISSFPTLWSFSSSTFLLLPLRSMTEAETEAEADLLRAEVSARKRILIISSSLRYYLRLGGPEGHT